MQKASIKTMAIAQNICYNCFEERENSEGTCPLCGYDNKDNLLNYPVALKTGSILNGQYIVGRVLGQGGFGITYLALDYQLKIKVAIKEYLPDGMATRMPDTTLVSVYVGEKQENFSYGAERFLDEARVLAKFIGNRSIAGVKSYFNENNTSYFVMDYIEGISFKSYIKNKGGLVDYRDALRILTPILRALSVVHREGFIHRDVTPDNIYITKDNEIKLLDFGSARYSLGDKSKSLDVILKAGYAPKEQYIRRGKQGPYTDIYSVAACFYASITGYLPPESLERMEEDNLVAISTRGINIPAYLEDAIMKGLEVCVEDRYQNADEFLAVIEAGQLNDVGQAKPPISLTTQSEPSDVKDRITEGIKLKKIVKNRLFVLIVGAICFVLVIIITAIAIQSQPAESKPVAAGISSPQISQDHPIKIKPVTISSVRGNTVGNIINAGLVAEQEGWVYYNNINDNDELYKMRTNGTEQMKLSEDRSFYINIVDGWVYYCNENDDCKLYKIRTDGTEKTKLNDDMSFYINVVDGWVYYCKNNDGKQYPYKMRTDGTEQTKLSDDGSSYLIIIDGWVYFCNQSYGNKLYKMRTDGTEKTKLNDDAIYNINVVDGWVNYENESDGGKLYKMRTDGTRQTKLNDDGSYNINVIDGWVYYRNISDDGRLYKMHTDGTEQTRLNDNGSYNINVVGDWVFYCNESDDSKLYKMHTDGTECKCVSGESNTEEKEFILPDSDSRYLTMVDLDGLSTEECRIARNELYARHGRKFKSEELQNYFNSCSWYLGTVEQEDFDESVFNEYEVANRDLIVKYETEQGNK